jgi:hypothetical protein
VDIIRLDIIGYMFMDRIYLTQDNGSGGFLWTWKWILGIHKSWGMSQVSEEY